MEVLRKRVSSGKVRDVVLLAILARDGASIGLNVPVRERHGLAGPVLNLVKMHERSWVELLGAQVGKVDLVLGLGSLQRCCLDIGGVHCFFQCFLCGARVFLSG